MSGLCILLLSGALCAALADGPPLDVRLSPAQRDERGVLTHLVESPYQAGTTKVRVLVPQGEAPGRRYPVIYLLPVEARDEARYGDGMTEVLRYRLHDRHRVVVVAPTFSHLPWYADHPTDPRIRQETHLLRVVLPLVETRYPVEASPRGRLLVGFSKSGWGAFSLLLRHPQVFGKAVAWDAPLLLDRPGRYGSGGVFATQDNFDRYRITTLVESRAVALRGEPRLLLLGFGDFRAEHRGLHELLTKWQVAHDYRDGPPRRHDWHSGWLPEAVEWLSGNNSGRATRSARLTSRSSQAPVVCWP